MPLPYMGGARASSGGAGGAVGESRGRWTIRITCSLCTDSAPSVSGDDVDELRPRAEKLARSVCFVPLPAAPSRRRGAGYLCGACARDVWSAYEEQGR